MIMECPMCGVRFAAFCVVCRRCLEHCPWPCLLRRVLRVWRHRRAMKYLRGKLPRRPAPTIVEEGYDDKGVIRTYLVLDERARDIGQGW